MIGPFQSESTIAFIGDSNTSAEATTIAYLQFVQYFYRTRFPERTIQMVNCGVAGDTYAGAVRRMDWDILPRKATHAVIQLGTNDVEYEQYPRCNAVKHWKLDCAAEACGKLVDTLQSHQVSPILLLPGGFYEGENHPRSETFLGANAALEELGLRIKKLYKKTEIPVLDLSPVFRQMREVMPPETMTPDRIHLRAVMHLLIATVLTMEQGFGPVVASARVGTNTRTHRATVQNVNTSASAASFTYRPLSFPCYDSEPYRELDAYFPITERFNQEILAVEGLEGGRYLLALNGRDVGIYTAAEVAAGINIACSEANPNRQVSAELYRLLCAEWYAPMHDLRRLAYQIVHCKERGIDLQRIPGYRPEESQGVEPAFLEFCGPYYGTILQLFRHREANESRLTKLRAEADGIGGPTASHVTVRQVGID